MRDVCGMFGSEALLLPLAYHEPCQLQPVCSFVTRGCRPYALVEHSLAHWTSRHSGEAVPRGLLRDLLAESVAPCAVRFLGAEFSMYSAPSRAGSPCTLALHRCLLI